MNFRILPPLLGLTFAALTAFAHAADRDRLQAFVDVTGYDVVIESLQQGAMAGPGLVGQAPDTFGAQYTALAKKVFDPDEMNARALDIMAAVMPDDLLAAGADFYASDLGQRLVAVENASHLDADDEGKYAEGSALVERLTREDPERVELLKRMNVAIGSEETSQKAIVEIQVRFLMASEAAGVSDLGLSEGALRAALMEAVRERAPETALYTLVSNAWTYRDIADADLKAYVEALETPEMRRVYEVLNAVQYQVMVERYEMLGQRLGELAPQQEL